MGGEGKWQVQITGQVIGEPGTVGTMVTETDGDEERK